MTFCGERNKGCYPTLRKLSAKFPFCRERNDGCYTALTYLSAKILEEALVALLQSLVFACIVWFPLQLTGSFALFWYTYFQTTLIGIRESSCDYLMIISACCEHSSQCAHL